MNTERAPVDPADEILIAQRRVKAVEVVPADPRTPEEIAEAEEKADQGVVTAAAKIEAKHNREAAQDPSEEDKAKIAALRGGSVELNEDAAQKAAAEKAEAEKKAANKAAADKRAADKKAVEKKSETEKKTFFGSVSKTGQKK